MQDGRRVRARRVLVTSGLVDELPDVDGLWERWGRDVVHCPYCHGWEVRDRAIGVLANGPMSVHGALLWRQWSDDVTLFCHTMAAPTGEQAEQLAARGIRVVTGEVANLEVSGDRLTGVRLADGTVIAREVLAAPPRMVARAGFLADLGLHPVAHPSGMGDHIPADPTGRTEVPGVWVAGNVADLAAQVGGAAAAGAVAEARSTPTSSPRRLGVPSKPPELPSPPPPKPASPNWSPATAATACNPPPLGAESRRCCPQERRSAIRASRRLWTASGSMPVTSPPKVATSFTNELDR